ncbi:MAG: AgmX/PglI C-terminal domain-containing protein [Gammaproteobacteria bacterium]|nr:AgmX/PglI C-terminal domain-containing protein [Gammaproteobacteria bacterium]MDH5628753.1 AgmX/PglI C-terminal domain-containing protein [Gammaproteobacteria bacterium]
MNELMKQQYDLKTELSSAYNHYGRINEKIQDIEKQLDKIEREADKYQLLSELLAKLTELENAGGSHLFWGDLDANAAKSRIERIQNSIANHDEKVEKLHEQHEIIRHQLFDSKSYILELEDELSILEEIEEEAKDAFVIEREGEINVVPFHKVVMPWNSKGEDEKRYRHILWITLFATIVLSYLITLWEPIKRDMTVEEEMPERFAKLIKEKKPPPPKPQEQNQQQASDKTDSSKQKPTEQQKKDARKKAESSGLLALKNEFSDLMDNDIDQRLGSQANLSNAGQNVVSTRSIISTQATTGTSGINTTNLSRSVDGNISGISGISFSRVESNIGTDYIGDEGAVGGGLPPSRSDEDILQVLEKYKGPLFRIYNRELRNDPTLQGTIILRITIESDGSVSACSIDSSDMNSDSLHQKIIERVLKFNFGAKEDVGSMTLTLPLNFLPPN